MIALRIASATPETSRGEFQAPRRATDDAVRHRRVGCAANCRALVASDGRVVRLRAGRTGRMYPRCDPGVPAAHWFEREIHDLYGVVPDGHPRLEPLVRHEPDPREITLGDRQRCRGPSTAAHSDCRALACS